MALNCEKCKGKEWRSNNYCVLCHRWLCDECHGKIIRFICKDCIEETNIEDVMGLRVLSDEALQKGGVVSSREGEEKK